MWRGAALVPPRVPHVPHVLRVGAFGATPRSTTEKERVGPRADYNEHDRGNAGGSASTGTARALEQAVRER
jgi:hypothetical protein